MMGGAKVHYDGIVAISQTDSTADLKKISVPVLVMHGDDEAKRSPSQRNQGDASCVRSFESYAIAILSKLRDL